jgi:hypothetical protein
MTIKAMNPLASFWYTPRAEEGAPNPTRFKIRGLNGTEQGYIVPELTLDPMGRIVAGMSGRGIEMALAYGLTDWENLVNGKGTVAFGAGNFGLLDYAMRVELAMKILAASYVEAEEKKT